MESRIEQSCHAAGLANILLVDDRPENLLALEAVLTSPDYRLFKARSGEEALKCVLAEDIAVILLDVQMPGMDGFQTASLIKSRERSQHIPIIFVTAISQAAEHVERGYSVGAIDYIFKPFHPETLKMKIEAFVQIYRYQEQIRYQNELMRAFNETSSDGLITTDAAGVILTASAAVETMFGWQPEELIGQPVEKLVPSVAHRDTDAKEARRIIQSSCLRRDRSLFPADIQISEVTLHGSTIRLIAIRDVTERRLLEKERFRKLFDVSPSLVAVRSLIDGRYVNVNQRLLQVTGYSKEELIGRNVEWLHDMPSEEDRQEGEGEGTGLDPEAVMSDVRVSFITKSGELREGLMSTERIEIHGEPCLLMVVNDVTDRLLFEKEMARLDRLNLTGEMAAGIVHEIRNPMTTVRGFLQLSKRQPSAAYTDIMIEELDRAHHIVTEFLAVAGMNPTNRRTKQLNKVIEALYPLIQSKAMYANQQVRLELDESCPMLQLDEKEIRQLLLNLVLNGLDAMQEGGQLTIRTYRAEEEVVLEIEDQGCGIKEELIAKLGTPFFSTKATGTGLGLSVCYKIAERHDAVIKVKSGEQGTVFYVHFRLQPHAGAR